MAADQRKRRPTSTIGPFGCGIQEQYRAKKREFRSLQYEFNHNSHVSLKWDDDEKMVVAKEEQIGISSRHLAAFGPISNAKLADVVSVPKEVFELENLAEVLTYEDWHSLLTDKDRSFLAQFLPRGFESDEVVQALLGCENIDFGNPFLKWGSSLCLGDLHPDAVVRYEKSFKANKKAYYSELQQYHDNMIRKLQKLKERCGTSKDPESEILKLMSRSKGHTEKNVLPDSNGFSSQKFEANATYESASSIADDKSYYSDNQKLSVIRDAEIQRRIRNQELIKDKHEKWSSSPNSLKGLPRPKKAEKSQKANIPSNDGTKYMSYVKISKKQHEELVLSMGQSGPVIQPKNLNRLLGNLDSYNVKPYVMFEEEEQKRIHEHWRNMVQKDLPAALQKWRRGQLERLQIMGFLCQEIEDKLALLTETENEKSVKPFGEEIADAQKMDKDCQWAIKDHQDNKSGMQGSISDGDKDCQGTIKDHHDNYSGTQGSISDGDKDCQGTIKDHHDNKSGTQGSISDGDKDYQGTIKDHYDNKSGTQGSISDGVKDCQGTIKDHHDNKSGTQGSISDGDKDCQGTIKDHHDNKSGTQGFQGTIKNHHDNESGMQGSVSDGDKPTRCPSQDENSKQSLPLNIDPEFDPPSLKNPLNVNDELDPFSIKNQSLKNRLLNIKKELDPSSNSPLNMKEEFGFSSMENRSSTGNPLNVKEEFRFSSMENKSSTRNPLNVKEEFGFSSMENRSSTGNPPLDDNQEFEPMDINSENNHVYSETLSEEHVGQISEVSLGISHTKTHGSSVNTMWSSIGLPQSYGRAHPTIPFASSSELTIRHPQLVPEQPSHLIDLERTLPVGTTKDLLNRHTITNHMPFIDSYTNRERIESLLPSLILRDTFHQEQKKTGSVFHPANVLVGPNQFPTHIRNPSFAVDHRQRAHGELFMNQNIYSDNNRYSIPGQEQLWANARPSTQMQSQLSSSGGQLNNHSWFANDNRVAHSGWSSPQGTVFSTTSLGSGSGDQSLYSVLSQFNSLQPRAHYNHPVGPTEQMMMHSTSYGQDMASPGIPMTSNPLPQTASPFDYLSGAEATSTATLRNPLGWMSLGHQSSSLQDPSGKPFMKSWNP